MVIDIDDDAVNGTRQPLRFSVSLHELFVQTIAAAGVE
jgi:hypothetical protein